MACANLDMYPVKHKVKIVSLTDLHMGNPRVQPAEVHEHLRRTFYPQLINNGVHLLAIVGDFFDTLLSLNSLAGYHSILIAKELLELAAREHFFIRVVRGTFSHDRHQNQLFLQSMENEQQLIAGEPLVKVVDAVNIEHIKALNIDLMYIPDDLPKMDIYQVIEHQLKQVHLTQVDVILSHGYFEHLLPKGIPFFPPNTLSHRKIKQYVKGVVLNGHIHTASVYKNIVSGGSFERFCHGEEDPKGFFIIEYDLTSHKCTFQFVENKDAICFRKIDLTGEDIESSAKKFAILLTSLTEQYPNQRIYVQLVTDDLAVKQVLELYTKQHFPDILCSTRKVQVTNQMLDEIKFSVADLPLITEQNLLDMVFEQLQLKHLLYSKEEIEAVLNAA